MASESKGTVLFALSSNLGIALAKAVAGVLSGSSAMLAEAAHSTADTINEVFLLTALRRGAKQSDATHPSATARSASSGRFSPPSASSWPVAPSRCTRASTGC